MGPMGIVLAAGFGILMSLICLNVFGAEYLDNDWLNDYFPKPVFSLPQTFTEAYRLRDKLREEMRLDIQTGRFAAWRGKYFHMMSAEEIEQIIDSLTVTQMQEIQMMPATYPLTSELYIRPNDDARRAIK